ncbi:MAG: hypothetical protein EXQ94_08370 [Alphaproteobacteria bacterium]|nr:hypothetical protein [Alphaproteobacteria bacterium]
MASASVSLARMGTGTPKAGTAPLLETRKAAPAIKLIDAILAAKRAGKGYAAQLVEMRRLRRAPGRLRPLEYYAFGLYDDRRFTREAKALFVGERGQIEIFRRLSDRSWLAAAHDKLLYYTILVGLGLAVPNVFAVFHATRRFRDAARLRTVGEVADFLRRSPYPLFGKPVTGKYSVGTVLLAGYDAATDTITASDGRSAPVAAFAAELAGFAADGYLFQERLIPHPAAQDLVGDRIATVRVVVLLDAPEPEILFALWKIPTGSHVADNFWRTGNILAALDPATGAVVRAIQGIAQRRTELSHHPDTGRPLVGATVPDWERAKHLCLATASAFPGLRLQAWDVAPCASGPLLLELNVGGDVNLPQHAFGRGVYDGPLRAALEALQGG